MDIRHYFGTVQSLLDEIPFQAVDDVVNILMEAARMGRMVYVFGNGGSAATATHMGCDLAKRPAVAGQPRLRVIALNDNTSIMTAISNDINYDEVFAEQLRPLVRPDDIVIGISGSGNSRNVLNAIQVANDVGAVTIGFCGFDGGKLRGMVQYAVHVPSDNMAMVEDVHLMLEHAICEKLLALNLENSHIHTNGRI